MHINMFWFHEQFICLHKDDLKLESIELNLSLDENYIWKWNKLHIDCNVPSTQKLIVVDEHNDHRFIWFIQHTVLQLCLIQPASLC